MKEVLLILLWMMVQATKLMAQTPDPIPVPDFPDEPPQDSVALAKEVPDSLLGPNVLLFCGQKVNLDPMDRQLKLRRELGAFGRISKSLRERAAYFFPIVEPILRQHGIPDDFKYLMVIESGMNPEARSGVGALGLWQFMRETAREYGLRVDGRIDERLDIEKSTHAACRYLKDAHRKFDDWVAVAQSYNIGQARIAYELAHQKISEALDLELVEETNRYVYRILAVKIIFTHPANFGLKPLPSYYRRIRR